MNLRRILAIAVLIIGLLMLGASQYIKSQVAAGKVQIADAQKKVNQGNALFSLSPYTKPAGDELTASAQKKINAGKEEVGYYASLASKLAIAGSIVAVVGFIFLIIQRKPKFR